MDSYIVELYLAVGIRNDIHLSDKKVCRNQEVRFYEYIIYTICLLIGISSEQLVFVLLIVFGAGNVIWYQANKRINKYLAVQLLICIAGLVNAMACPGNALRTADSIEQFFPAFADFGIIKKVELGISYTLKTLFLQDNIWMLMFLILLCAAIWMKYDNWFYKVLGGCSRSRTGLASPCAQRAGRRRASI